MNSIAIFGGSGGLGIAVAEILAEDYRLLIGYNKNEAKALELCERLNLKGFNTSADNLNGYQGDNSGFKTKVYQQVLVFIEDGFPPRAQKFINALASFYQTKLPLTAEQFNYQSDVIEQERNCETL